jgi:hypothetical protein
VDHLPLTSGVAQRTLEDRVRRRAAGVMLGVVGSGFRAKAVKDSEQALALGLDIGELGTELGWRRVSAGQAVCPSSMERAEAVRRRRGSDRNAAVPGRCREDGAGA